MICTASISRLRNKKFDNFTKVAIVRSNRQMNGIKRIATLSPDWELFMDYRKMANDGTWGQEAFDNEYTPRFLKQMKQDQKTQELLDKLALASHDHDIVLACFCGNVNTCHRSLIAKLLEERGAYMGTIE